VLWALAAQPQGTTVTQLHVIPIDDEPEQHTLGKCRCGPSRRWMRVGGIFDWVHIHRSLTAPDDWDEPVLLEPVAA
jgi:hypothetical protein